MKGEQVGIDPVQTRGRARWVVSIDGANTRHLQSRYEGRVAEEEWDTVRDTAANALSQCPGPEGTASTVTGLALGKIQSGKTLSYSALIALATDNGYQIAVVLAGTKNALLEQNYARLCHDLEIPRPDLTPFKNPPPEDAEVVDSVLHGGGHALIVVLKHKKHIDNVRRLLSVPELRCCPTLIVDDEGDEASLNTQFKRGSRSAIYRSITRLREALAHHAFVAYTATPQANLLIPGIDGLSPDFGLLLQPGQGYCGGSMFFGPDRDKYVRVVPTEEAEPEHAQGVPDGLRGAIMTFLVGGAIRRLRRQAGQHSMLIHTSKRKADHVRLQDGVKSLITLWKETLKLPDSDPAAADVLRLARGAYDDLCRTVQEPVSWEEVSKQLPHEVWLVEVWMVNSLPVGKDPISTPFRLPNNILVGGEMLGRGVTIEGLAVTYITRRAQNKTNADTMEQRARWFGYKETYLDVCRIFVTPELEEYYAELLRHEDDFWDALRRNERQGLSVREWPRMFALDTSLGLRPTRASVASSREFRSTGWEIQTRYVEDATVGRENVRAIKRFFATQKPVPRRYGHVTHHLVHSCPVQDVIRNLLSELETEGTDWENSYVMEYLARLLMGGRLLNLDVLQMAGDEGEFRKRGKDVQPMQGHDTHRDPSDPNYYPGDRYIHGDQPQLQVHLIRLDGSEAKETLETHALALYIPPEDSRFDLRYVVRDEGAKH